MSQVVHEVTLQCTTLLHCSTSFSAAWQGMPSAVGSCSMDRRRYFMSSPSHGVQEPHLPRRQSCRSSMHIWALHFSISSSASVQGSPPPAAGFSISRLLVRRPPPQVRVHSVHIDQNASSQLRTFCSPSAQDAVSFTTPAQGVPPFCASRATLRMRILWSFSSLHSLGCHACHASHSQSSGAEQSFSHLLVSTSGPAHGLPPYSDSSAIVRLRVHIWSQPGSDHSSQALNLQSRGMCSFSQGLYGQIFTSIWLPLHGLFWSTASKKVRAPWFSVDRVSCRWRLYVA
mmetsp:Transcript_26196/g.66776  ORF Transcript_26196/g.66776 Transcript_26196/m.66776 type:complete len:286 (+) Transcript_26196:2429-3286(+)